MSCYYWEIILGLIDRVQLHRFASYLIVESTMALYDIFTSSTSLTSPFPLTVGILSISLSWVLWYLRRGKQTQSQNDAPPFYPFDPATLDRKQVSIMSTRCTIHVDILTVQTANPHLRRLNDPTKPLRA